MEYNKGLGQYLQTDRLAIIVAIEIPERLEDQGICLSREEDYMLAIKVDRSRKIRTMGID